MGVPSGLGSQLGIATESAYGTYQAPVTFFEYDSETLTLVPNYIRQQGLRAGAMMQAENLHVQTTRQVSGDVSFAALDKGLGKLLNMLHGAVVTPAAYTGGLLRQTHPIGLTAPMGKSLTVQVGRPDISGTINPFSFIGAKIVNAVFTLAVNGIVTVALTLDCQDETTAQTLAVATYPTTAKPFNFIAASIQVDGVLLTDIVTSATVTIPLVLKTDRFGLGSGATKQEPIPNGLMNPTIDLAMEFTSLTQHTAFKNATRRKIELDCAGSTTSGTYTSALNMVAASTVTVDATPLVAGPDVLSQTVKCEVVDLGTGVAPLSIDYITADATL